MPPYIPPVFDRFVSLFSGKMNVLRKTAHHLDKEFGRSTFGRVFRLEGCGHVSLLPMPETLTSRSLHQGN